jgi:hypothetical protein
MAAEGNGQKREYHVDFAAIVAQQIKSAAERAKELGRLQQVIDALKVIERRLRTDPLSFGEFTNEPPGNLIYHTGTIFPLSVIFAIDRANAVVYIRKVVLSSASE